MPKTTIGRALVLLWLLMCVGLLVFGYVQREIHDMPVAFTWFLIGLAFPVGLPAAAIVGMLTSSLSEKLGLPYSPFLDLLPSWVAVVSLGYLQWFVFLPSFGRWLLRRKHGI